VREKEMPHMTESLTRIQRRITPATGTPTRLNRPDVTPADSADESAAKHRHYPQHYVFLEQALMARGMERC
jgi:hypothetical protein